MARPIVEIVPAVALDVRRRLFAALSEALDLDFSTPGSTPAVAAGRVLIDEDPGNIDLPTLVLGAARGLPGSDPMVQFADSDAVPEPLRGWSIPDDAIGMAHTLESVGQATVLARVSGRPVWTSEQQDGVRLDRAALVPAELGDADTLLGRWAPQSYFDLLPLVHFFRSLDRTDAWSQPPLMASFIMDDPNLRSERYGYIDFLELAEQGFHTSVSTIPLDGWHIRSRVAELFRSHPDTLSLLIHGNNHTLHELEDGRGDEARLRMLAQALRRARSVAARAGVAVAEVMAAPHGRCSEESARDMALIGYESLCISRPFPWLDKPPGDHPLAGWCPADASTPTPVLPRIPISARPDALPLRAYLGQPIIVYGHHWDLADQPDLLHRWAGDIARLGDVTWASVGEISRRMFSWRANGDALIVRPHTRVVEVDLPDFINRITVDAPPGPGYELVEIDHGARLTTMPRDEADSVVSEGRSLTIRLVAEDAIAADQVPDPLWRPWPIMRRLLTEARDRSQPRRDALLRLSGAPMAVAAVAAVLM